MPNYTTRQLTAPSEFEDCWLELVADSELLELAFSWCCRSRQHFPPAADIWLIRERWAKIKPTLQAQLLNGSFRFDAMQRFRTRDEDVSRAVWGALDAIVVKALSMVLTLKLRAAISPDCTHVKGHGGVPAMVAKVRSLLRYNQYFFKSDIASYYSTIDHGILIQQLGSLIKDERVVALLEFTIRRDELISGNIVSITGGIPLGSPLSPLLAAIYLHPLDSYALRYHLNYARFMDDFVFICSSKAKLTQIMHDVTQIVTDLKLILHPAKTASGTLAGGFNLLGFYWRKGFVLQPQLARLMLVYLRLISLPLTKALDYFRGYRAYLRGCKISLLNLF